MARAVWGKRGVVAVAAFLSWLGAPFTAAAEPRSWLLATLAPEGSPTANMVNAVASLMARASGGELRIKRRMGGVLGDELDTLVECQQGRIEVFMGSLGAAVSLVPELRFLEQPYLFADVATFQRVMKRLQDGRHPDLQALFHRRGLELIGMAAIGWRNLSSVRRPIRAPADLQGAKVRAQPGDLNPQFWRALGALPKEIALTELNSALEIQLVEAFDVPATFVYATSLDARIKFYTLTQHILQIGVWVVNKQAWDGLPAARRSRILEGVPQVVARGETEHVRFDEEITALLPGRGVSILRPSAAELAAFRAASAPVEAHIRRTGSKAELALFDRVKAIIAERPLTRTH